MDSRLSIGSLVILSTAVTATGSAIDVRFAKGLSIQAVVTGTGAVTGTVIIDVSNDGVNWAANAGTITLSGTTSATDLFNISASHSFVRARCTVITGTSALVVVTVGV